jgi:hypothetical protein
MAVTVTMGAVVGQAALAVATTTSDTGGGNGLLAVAVVALVALAVVWLFSSTSGRSGRDAGRSRRRGDDDRQDQPRRGTERGAVGSAQHLSGQLRGQHGSLDEVHRILGELMRTPDLEPNFHRKLTMAYNQVDRLIFDTRESYREADRLVQQLSE